MSDVNNLSHNEEHLNVCKVNQNVSIKNDMAKTNSTLLHQADMTMHRHVFYSKTKLYDKINVFKTSLQHKQDKAYITYFLSLLK